MEGSSFWQTLADNPPEETPQRDFDDLPPGAFVLMETAGEKNGKAVPGYYDQENKDKTTSYLMFSVGLLAKGGDSKIDREKHLNAMVWLRLFVRPGEKEDQTKHLSGRITGFFNTLFAPGITDKDPKVRARLRWAKTMSELRQVAETYNLTPEQYGGDMAKYLCGLATKALLDQPRRLVLKTKLVSENWKTKEKLQKPRIEASMMEDATPEALMKRQIALFEQTNRTTETVVF